MLWGNIIGVALCFIQSQFHLFKLDPATYYVDRVPVEFNIWIYLLLNVCTLLVSVLMLVGPSFLVTRIHPANLFGLNEKILFLRFRISGINPFFL